MCTGYPVGLTVGLMRVKAVGRGWSGFGPSTPSACASSGVAGTVRGGVAESFFIASAGAAVGVGVGCVLYAVGYGDV